MAAKRSRRDFLRGHARPERRSALGRSGGQPAAAGESPSERAGGVEPRSLAGAYQLTLSTRAMACEFQAIFNLGQYERANQVGMAALELLAPLEDKLSYFRSSSALNRVNAAAALQPVEVDPELFALLTLARHIWHQTGGAFDITSAPVWRLWGFARREGRVPDDAEIREALGWVGSQYLELSAKARTVRFRQEHLELNLGSIGKGYALDRCAEKILGEDVRDFLLHGGFSSIVARGSRWEKPHQPDAGGGWPIGLAHPLRRGQRIGHLRLRDAALGTSGSALQFFRHKGKRYGHVIDPRTGYPAEHFLSVTVVAPTAAEADALATASFVMDKEQIQQFCSARPELAVIVIEPGPGGPGLQIETFNADALDLEITQRW